MIFLLHQQLSLCHFLHLFFLQKKIDNVNVKLILQLTEKLTEKRKRRITND